MVTDISQAFELFVAADEVADVFAAFTALLNSITGECGEAAPLGGRALYSWIRQHASSTVAYRSQGIFRCLDTASSRRSRPPPTTNDGHATKLLISGAGPCGLRAAVEAALVGFECTVIEKRQRFSRANILTLWRQTADDLFALGAKIFYKDMAKHGQLYLGTREIQLVLLKVALLLGVRVLYGTSLQAIAPPSAAASTQHFTAICSEPLNLVSTTDALAFKAMKYDDYEATYKCNMIANPQLDKSLFEVPMTSSLVRLPFDSIILAEGEHSETSKRLGFRKSVDRFTQALGLVVNQVYDSGNRVEKEMRTAVLTQLTDPQWRDGVIGGLARVGIDVENIEYLKGTTHYTVVTVTKASLLRHNVLRHDASKSTELLTKENLDLDALHQLAKLISVTIGLPESCKFCSDNPVQIFDFSSRARCSVPAKYLRFDGETTVLDRPQPLDGKGVIYASVFPIGDTLLEPFWPQGLGSNRGFHGALDAVFAAIVQSYTNIHDACVEREFSYSCMNMIAWSPRVVNPENVWSTDPITRYNLHVMKEACKHAKAMDGARVPQRIRDQIPVLDLWAGI